ncbi:MAG: hypothetical protein JO154_22585 [Chitinophaga sp.]|uniref:hypothetical protein n=1 Tax=Chitinophaga sp. TaxID=1869181 RepID=UPI0025BEE2D3|nr:hypothetical protein [Chitinophaga sp.]MBV8255405.1 hypothetical protein [Chitinophaga sp.]
MKKILTIILLVSLFKMNPSSATGIRSFKVDTSGTCYSAILDTAVNPYTLGIAGNWRPQATYVFYGNRTETNAAQDINIRQAGTLAAYVPFWKRDNNAWKANTDTPWVWNQQSTIYNVKGFELENKDPLGRYNAGMYGYDNELPVAVIQNARYQEVAYDGFEDYGYGMSAYDTACPVSKGFDFLPYKQWIDSTVAHTGIYSLLIPGGHKDSIGVYLTTTDVTDFDFAINKRNMACTPGVGLQGIRANTKVIIPSFAPYPGKKMLLSVWIKEKNDCNCSTYTKGTVTVRAGGATITCKPSGNIIDGWQRIEEVLDIPADATYMTVDLTASADVYFDDLRIHPYNANMQSYAYDPITLRLMAQLDENNYATFYEYDDDGTLVRVKKETERGIMTIKETRSALIK